jgi:hypothetical protein
MTCASTTRLKPGCGGLCKCEVYTPTDETKAAIKRRRALLAMLDEERRLGLQ